MALIRLNETSAVLGLLIFMQIGTSSWGEGLEHVVQSTFRNMLITFQAHTTLILSSLVSEF